MDLRTNTILWSFVGDGALDMKPIVAGGYVYTGFGTGEIFLLDATSGRVAFSERLPSGNEGNPGNAGPAIAMAVGSNTLVVTEPDLLVAFVPWQEP